MRALSALAGLALVAALAGCSDDGDSGKEEPAAKEKAGPQAPEVIESGFGQSGQYVQAIVVVKNADEASVGEFVTVSVNFKDEAGNLLSTETQTESFTWVGQELVLPVFADLESTPKAKVSTIEPTVTISDHGSSAQPMPPLEPVEAERVAPDEYGGTVARFVLTNAASEPLEDARIGVLCRDAAGKIVGGTSEYPELVPPGGEIAVDATVTVTGKVAACTAYPNYGV